MRITINDVPVEGGTLDVHARDLHRTGDISVHLFG